MMSDRSRNSDILTLRAGAFAVAAALGLAYPAWASAFEVGHSRVTSTPGQPLSVAVPLTGLTAAQGQSLSVSLAEAAQWQAAGLTPPVALESLRLNVGAGRSADSRLIQVSSTQVSQSTVIDLLLNIRTDDASRTVQTSVIVAPPPQVRLSSEAVTVQRGDTLIGIANQFPVSGATLYQRLWAIYSANPRAFIDENMNLLRSGASLRIPDDATVRAVDPAFARAQYLEHVRAFRQRRSGGQGDQGIAAQAAPSAAQATEAQTSRGEVEPASSAPPQAVTDQVRVTAAAEDQATALAKAAGEERDRTAQLEQNIGDLRTAIAEAGAAADAAQNSAQGAARDAVTAGQGAVDAARDQAEKVGDDAARAAQDASDAVQGAARDAVTAGQGAVDAAREQAEKLGDDAAKAAQDASDAVQGAARDAVTAGQGAVDAAREQAEKLGDDAAKAAQDAARDAMTAGQGALDAAREQAEKLGDDAVKAAQDASDAVQGAARDAMTAGQGAVDAAREQAEKVADEAAQAVKDAAAGVSQQAEQAKTVFQRIGHWIQNNVAAALALLLAFIALIAAWVFRGKRAAKGTSQSVQDQVDQAASNFEEKLKEIDLSLDNNPDTNASSGDQKQNDKPST